MKKIAYRDLRPQGSENNIPLLLLHGFCEDNTVWKLILPMLKDLPIVVMDLPGFGKSKKILDAQMADYSAAVLSIMDGLNIRQAVVIGHSLGGYVALDLAKHHSSRLAAIGLIHSHPFADSPEKIIARERGIALIRGGRKPEYLRLLFNSLFPPAFSAKNPGVLDDLYYRSLTFTAKGIIEGLRVMMHREDQTALLSSTDLPVFMAIGTDDGLLPPFQENEMLTLPRISDVHIWEGVGHMAMFEAPEKLASALRGFCSFVEANRK